MFTNKLPDLRLLKKSQKIRLSALVVILIALPVFVLLVQQVVRYFSRAQATQPTLYFTPSPTSLNNGQETTLTLRLDPKGNKISGITLRATFPNNLIQVVGTKEDLPLFPGNFFSVDTSGSPLSTVIVKPNYDTDANSTGEITFTIGVPLGGDINLTSPSTDFEVGKIRIKTITTSVQTANITIDTTSTDMVNPSGTSLNESANNAVINLNSGSGAGASIYFTPANSSLNINTNPTTTLSLMLDPSGNQIGFANVEASFEFDKTKIRLDSAINVSASPLTTVVQTTPLADANSTGKFRITLGLSTANRSSPPSNVFEIAKIPIRVTTTSTNQTATINITNTEVVAMNESAISVQTTPASFTLNPVATATPTPIPTNTPRPTNTPTPRPTNTPTPLASTTPTTPPTADMEVGLGRIVPQYPTGGQRFDWIEVLLTNKGTTAINQALTFRTTIRNTNNNVDQCIATETLNINIPVGQTVGYGLTRRFNTVPTADPCPLLEAGKSYTVTILGDSTNVLAETNENNNTTSFSFSTPAATATPTPVQLPDLQSVFVLTTPDPPQLGGTLSSVRVTVKNLSNLVSVPLTNNVKFTFSFKGPDGLYFCHRTDYYNLALGPLVQAAITFDGNGDGLGTFANCPGFQPGQNQIVIQVDATNLVAESNENNNSFTHTMNVPTQTANVTCQSKRAYRGSLCSTEESCNINNATPYTGPYLPGEEIVFALLTNPATGPVSNVSFTDIFDSRLEWVSGFTSYNNSCRLTTDGSIYCGAVSLNLGDQWAPLYKMRVKQGVSGNIKNTATLNSSSGTSSTCGTTITVPTATPTPTPQPLGGKWYDPNGNVCNSTNYVAYYSQPGCFGNVVYRVREIFPQSPCTTNGTGSCFNVGGNSVALNAQSAYLPASQECATLDPFIPAYTYENLYLCSWRP